jgi:resuscitation-promoting factor RpfB
MPDMLQKYGKNISLGSIFLGIGLIGIGLLSSNPTAGQTANTILVRSTGGLPPIFSADLRPGNILQKANIRLYPGDQILVDGQSYKPDQPLIAIKKRTIQIIPAARLTLNQNGKQKVIFSSAPTLGQALWDNGYRLTTVDRVSPSLDSLVAGDLQVDIQAARTVTVQDGKSKIVIHTAAEKVGDALAETGYALTALDSTDPAPDQPVPVGKAIQILHNTEEMVLTGKPIEFENEQVVIEEMDQGASEIVQQGENGLEVSRERVVYTNGKEVARHPEGTTILREPVKQITNVGSKAVVRSVDIGAESLDYYRMEEVYATSYSPCRQGYDHCSTGTASGTPLAKGVIAVTPQWYKIFGGTQVYIPGYGVGTIADTGGGIPGKYWIDLGFGEDDFVNWHQTVTIYFLNPAPANVPEVLP